uniref:Uncharacterized protein n=1 Tax=Romanomermis culicivorax TaxID=13658 RepID=A0A915JPW1_ROMCU
MVCYDLMLNINIKDANPFTIIGKIMNEHKSQNRQPGAVKNPVQTGTMEDLYRAEAEFFKNMIVANFVYSKQVRPTVDEDWTLSNANYARIKS